MFRITDSILDSVKKVLGLSPDYDVFDVDIIMHINSVFSTLHDLGIGPDDGFEIEDDVAGWSSFLGDDKVLNRVKTYVTLKVRMLFDPPSTAHLTAAYEKQIAELEWRLNAYRESKLALVQVVVVTE